MEKNSMPPSRHPASNGTATVEMTLGAHLGQALSVRWRDFEGLVKRLRRKVRKKEVHAVRVTVRRLCALLDLIFETVPISAATKVRKRLKRCLAALGDLRDAQVQADTVADLLEAFPALQAFHQHLDKQVERLRKKAGRAMQDVSLRRLARRRRRLLDDATPHWTATKDERQRAQTAEAVGRAFSTVLERRTALDMTDLATVHKMRIDFKRFRYMVEVLQPFLSGVGSAQLSSMQAFQSMMGDVHDLDVLGQALNRFREKSGRPARLASVQDELAQRLLMAADRFMGASDEIYSFWNQAWFMERQ
ncbi:MAG TPA: CHAD domain-containing protein [Candidatus Xenobia bacterium]|jgi:CHAD domain-containing protein